jgi:tetratricopeptide (TPR) repeat protein
VPNTETPKSLIHAEKYVRKGQIRKAIAELEKALLTLPDHIPVRLQLAELYLKEDQEDKAVACFVQSAQLYEKKGQPEKGLTIYEQVVRVLPDRVELYVALAELYAKLGMVEQASLQYQKALEVLDETGDHASKLDVIEYMLALDPENVRVRVRLAESFIVARRIPEGVKHFRTAVTTLDERRQDGDEEATRDFQRVAERYLYHHKDDADVAKLLAASYLDTDEAARALPQLRLAYKATPKDLDVLRLLASTFDQLGQNHKSVTVLKEMAVLYDLHGLERERAKCYRQILRLNPTDLSVRRLLGESQSEVTGQTIEFDLGAEQSSGREAGAERLLDELPSETEVAVSESAENSASHDEQEQDFEIGFEDAGANEYTVVDDVLDVLPGDMEEVTLVEDETTTTGAEQGVSSLSIDEDDGFDMAHALGDEQTVFDPSIEARVQGHASHEPARSDVDHNEESLQIELQEVDFYLKNGFLEDGQALLQELRETYGDHPAIVQRETSIDRMEP